ncbi:GerMN domain-containing protein [Treponema primitia]|uniref:GerMN domain-containing protein n=1 Tax=Treponema primitia TaxID=88058 RepID=UPI003980387C
MAAPKNRKTNSPPPPKKSASFVFWTLFFIIVISLFFVNLQLIRSSVEKTGLLERLFNKTETEEKSPKTDVTELPAAPKLPAAPELVPTEEPPAADTVEQTPQAVPEPKPAAPPVSPTVPSRNQTLYFIQVDGDGALLRKAVTRSVKSASPLTDTLRLLLQGPTAEEQRRDLRSLIPPGTKLLRAEVRGSTAYINFSEEFQFGTNGVEGYMGQLWQIVWTATEFPNISDVQILIEGNVVNFLGEGINIGSPLSRNSF